MPSTSLETDLRQAVEALGHEPEVRGILALGSFVGGTMVLGSDVDLVVLHNRTGLPDRRYLCRELHGLRLDLKYWTPELAAAMLAGPQAAPVIMATGGVRVLLDRDGSAARLTALIRERGAPRPAPVSAVERLDLNACRRALTGSVHRAILAGDTAQAWCLIHWSVSKLAEAAHRLAGIPYVDLGKGLRALRERFPDLAAQVETALRLPDPDACRLALLALTAQVLGEFADEGEDFDTGWISD
jgi:hypothetical protein